MTINKTLENEKITLALEGRLDTTTAPRLQEALVLAFNEAKQIKLDFTELVYVSSAGLRVLLIGQKTAQQKEVPMTLYGVSEEVMEVFEMTGLSDLLTFE